jgi:hypothetical protein
MTEKVPERDSEFICPICHSPLEDEVCSDLGSNNCQYLGEGISEISEKPITKIPEKIWISNYVLQQLINDIQIISDKSMATGNDIEYIRADLVEEQKNQAFNEGVAFASENPGGLP